MPLIVRTGGGSRLTPPGRDLAGFPGPDSGFRNAEDTTAERPYPTRISLTFQGKRGQVALDQIRAVDRQRLIRGIGKVSSVTAHAVSAVLIEMFARR